MVKLIFNTFLAIMALICIFFALCTASMIWGHQFLWLENASEYLSGFLINLFGGDTDYIMWLVNLITTSMWSIIAIKYFLADMFDNGGYEARFIISAIMTALSSASWFSEYRFFLIPNLIMWFIVIPWYFFNYLISNITIRSLEDDGKPFNMSDQEWRNIEDAASGRIKSSGSNQGVS